MDEDEEFVIANEGKFNNYSDDNIVVVVDKVRIRKIMSLIISLGHCKRFSWMTTSLRCKINSAISTACTLKQLRRIN